MMIKMVVTDLDGTLLNSFGVTSVENLNTLKELNDKGITRVIATGRSLYSISKVISDDFPVDYIIFSSGAGIIKWSEKQILHSRLLERADVQEVVNDLISHNVDFMIHEPIPHNHCFLYHATNQSNPDFFRRIEVYQKFCQPYIPGVEFPNGATQLIAVLPNNPEMFSELSLKFPKVKVIRTTSPLDGQSIWMEIFPVDVSKAYGINWLCNNIIGCKSSDVVVIGNDFNDLDMLEFTTHAFVVENAPDELKSIYRVVPSNDKSGFSVAVNEILFNS
ncbi:MAG: HAD family hydrolase [Tenuifilaceae bacterium]